MHKLHRFPDIFLHPKDEILAYHWIVVKDSVTAQIVERVVIMNIWSGAHTHFARSVRRQHTVVSNVKR